VDSYEQLFNTISYMGRSNDMAKRNLKLFMLRHGQGGKPVKDEHGNVIYYNNKAVAKKNRGDNQVVSYGIDHRKFRTLEGSI
tara:strand:- start:2455 stop:2700 length:246 start_codon:yes stop_codon:yes gene_type:complete